MTKIERAQLFVETIQARLDGFKGWLQGITRIIVDHYRPHDTWTYGYREFIGDRFVDADYNYPFLFFEVLVSTPYFKDPTPAVWVEMRDSGNGKIRVACGGDGEIDGVAEILITLYEALLQEYLPDKHKDYERYKQDHPTPRLADFPKEWQWFDSMTYWIKNIPTESTRPAERDSVPPIVINGNQGVIQVAGGDITTGGDNVGRDKVTK